MKRSIARKLTACIMVLALAAGLAGMALATDATFKVPASPMTVDDNIITIAAHSQAYVTPEILGINNVTSRNSELPYTYKTVEEASRFAILGIFGSDINESPNPYLYNYFYNCYANENGLPLAERRTLSQGIEGSPAAADLNVLEEYGGTSVSLFLRPDILLGDNGTNAYNPLIADLPENNDGDPDTDYNPYQVNYPIVSTYNFLESLFVLAEICNEITANIGKVTRYGDPMVIATDMEKFVKGLQCYVLECLAQEGAQQKTVAIVDPINSTDGIFYAVDSASSVQSTTTQSRAGEYVADTTVNLVKTLGKTMETGTVGGTENKTYYVLTAQEIAQADILITSAVQNVDANEDSFRELLLTYVDPADLETVRKLESMPILSSRPNCVGSMGANAVENILGMAYWTAYCYPEYLNPVYVATYFYQNFYHVSDNSSLQTAIAANFGNASIPDGHGYTTDISAYRPSAIESQIIQGMRYYEANAGSLSDKLLYTHGNTGMSGWRIDWNSGIGAGEAATDAPKALAFSDVASDAWYYDYVAQACGLGLMQGVSSSSFAPGNNMTLAEAIAMAARVNDIYNGGSGKFEQGDVWYQVYVDFALEEGIIQSDDFDAFNTAATRAQMAYIFANALPPEGLEAVNTVDSLPDVDEDSPYADAIFTLYRAGVIQGNNEEGAFAPASNITRAEAAAIITRVCVETERLSFSF